MRPIPVDSDFKEASDAMLAGQSKCHLTRAFSHREEVSCSCDYGAIDGCKARLTAIAEAIAAARQP